MTAWLLVKTDEIELTETSPPIALVTGGGSGIGAACARRLAADGFAVAVADVDLDAARSIAADCGERARAVAVDVSDEASVQRMIEAVLEMPGTLLAVFVQRQIRSPRMLARLGPGCIAVAGEKEPWQVGWHWISLPGSSPGY